MDCNAYVASVPSNPEIASPPTSPGNWSAPHNCTSCQAPPTTPLASYTGVTSAGCAANCVSNTQCRYINWVKPDEESALRAD